MNEYINFLINETESGISFFSDQIKLLVYKEAPDLFSLLDFENNNIWMDPMLFAYYNNSNFKNKNTLWQILYGYVEDNKKPESIEIYSDKYGIIYLSNFGWIKNLNKNTLYNLNYTKSGLKINGNQHIVEDIVYFNKVNLEHLCYPVEILDCRYFNYKNEIQNVRILGFEEIQKKYIENAIDFMNRNVLSSKILNSCRKVVFFKDGSRELDLRSNINSFATLNSQGIVYININQPWFNEVFYIDEIIYQSSRLLFNIITTDTSNYYKLDPKSVIISNSEYGKKIDKIESRSYEIVFQAIFSYFNTITILDLLYDSNFYIENKKEILARIAFKLSKLFRELELFETFDNNLINANIYNEKGMLIFNHIKNNYIKFCSKYYDDIKFFNFSNQSYKFNYKLFLQNNEI